MPTQRFVGSLLMARRQEAGRSREWVALKVGRSHATIVLYEQGAVIPPGNMVGALAAALDCSVADFYELVATAA